MNFFHIIICIFRLLGLTIVRQKSTIKEDTIIGTKETWKRDLKIGAILRGIEDALKDIMHKLSISVIYSYSCHVKTPPRLDSKYAFDSVWETGHSFLIVRKQ